jgi:hypothetical protein
MRRFLERLNESRIESGHIDDLVIGTKVALDERMRCGWRLGVSVIVSGPPSIGSPRTGSITRIRECG